MAKNDVVVRTAADLERKYNFASLLGLKKNVEITAQGIQKLENELNSMLNALVINLKDVLDTQNEISLYFYEGKPTTSNVPYTLWNNPNDHIGDIYYDQKTGAVYQWNGVWEVNTHPDLVEAMAITNAEIDTSEDHERKVFFDTPTIPYSNGDWWIKEEGSLFICQISKTSGIYETDDFIDSSNYVESFAEKIGEELKVLKGTVTIISENYAKFTDLATGGSTVISGDNIVTGNIKSQNYMENISGTKINLTDGTIDTKGFKVDEIGKVTAKEGKIAGYSILNNTLKGSNVGMCGVGGEEYAFWAGTEAGENAPFRVTHTGDLRCSKAQITGGTIEGVNVSLRGAYRESKITLSATDESDVTTIAPGHYSITKGNGSKYYLMDTGTGFVLQMSKNNNAENLSLWMDDSFAAIGVGNNTTDQYTDIYASGINTPKITSGNIDCGQGFCNSNGYTWVSFNKTFPSVPRVVATPNTSTNGVIAIKIRNVSTTGFEATLGGTNFGNETFDWIAMSN